MSRQRKSQKGTDMIKESVYPWPVEKLSKGHKNRKRSIHGYWSLWQNEHERQFMSRKMTNRIYNRFDIFFTTKWAPNSLHFLSRYTVKIKWSAKLTQITAVINGKRPKEQITKVSTTVNYQQLCITQLNSIQMTWQCCWLCLQKS